MPRRDAAPARERRKPRPVRSRSRWIRPGGPPAVTRGARAHPSSWALGCERPDRGPHGRRPARLLDFLALEAGAALVLTDSGGVQKEPTVLGVLSLILWDNTERPMNDRGGHGTVSWGADPDRIDREATAASSGRRCRTDRHAGTTTRQNTSPKCSQRSTWARCHRRSPGRNHAGARVQVRLSALRLDPLSSRYP
jgi:UDP-N-acetylglucosamine 2-epimerase